MAKKSLRQRALGGEMVLGAMVFEFFTPGIASEPMASTRACSAAS